MRKIKTLTLGVPLGIKRNQRRRMSRKSFFSFGAHKGKTVEALLIENPQYLAWCQVNLKGLLFIPSVKKRIAKAIKETSTLISV